MKSALAFAIIFCFMITVMAVSAKNNGQKLCQAKERTDHTEWVYGGIVTDIDIQTTDNMWNGQQSFYVIKTDITVLKFREHEFKNHPTLGSKCYYSRGLWDWAKFE